MSSTELARIAIPPALQQAGVEVQEQDGVRVVHIPQELHRHYNVVQPLSEIVQADPDYTPGIALLHLDIDRHTYLREGKQDLTGAGIGLIGFAAGLDLDADPIPPQLLHEGTIGYKAYASIRRPDGTMSRWPGTHVTILADEYEIIAQRVRAKAAKAANEGNPWAADAIENQIKSTWLKEKKNLPQKAETGAKLRAITSVLQLKRGGYTKADLAKPFIVVKYGFTPSDPEVRRARALNAAGDLYGKRALALAPAVEPDLETSQYEPPTQQIAAPPSGVVDIKPSAAAEDFGAEPEPAAAPIAGEIPANVAAAGEVLVTFGKAAGVTREDGSKGVKVSELSPDHLAWLALQYDPTTPDRQAIVAAARVYHGHIASQR